MRNQLIDRVTVIWGSGFLLNPLPYVAAHEMQVSMLFAAPVSVLLLVGSIYIQRRTKERESIEKSYHAVFELAHRLRTPLASARLITDHLARNVDQEPDLPMISELLSSSVSSLNTIINQAVQVEKEKHSID